MDDIVQVEDILKRRKERVTFDLLFDPGQIEDRALRQELLVDFRTAADPQLGVSASAARSVSMLV